MKKSYIKLYGPPMDKALNELEKLAKDLPKISHGELGHGIIKEGEIIVGDYDFAFVWGEEPVERTLRLLVFNIDEALSKVGCRYTMITK